jgi:hypothetical protein
MVVIGLIIGMALKGKSLLESATIRNEVNKLSLMQSAVATLLTTSSRDGSLNELPKKDNGSYDYIENSFLINKGLLSAKDVSYNGQAHEIRFCRYPNTTDSQGFYIDDTAKSDNMLCAITADTWAYKFHCVAEVIFDDQKVRTGKGRSTDAASDTTVGGSDINPYNCNKSAKETGSYSYLLLTSKLVK